MARSHSRAPRYSAQQWAGWIDEQEQSGLSIDEFCAQRQVGLSTFRKWRLRLKGNPPRSARKPSSTGFVEALPASRLPPPIVVRLGDSVQLEIPTTLDAGTIAEITNALASHGRG